MTGGLRAAIGKALSGFREALSPVGAVNPTHDGMLKAMALKVEAQTRPRRLPRRLVRVRSSSPVGVAQHKRATFKLKPTDKPTVQVPIYYAIPVDYSRYDGEKLR